MSDKRTLRTQILTTVSDISTSLYEDVIELAQHTSKVVERHNADPIDTDDLCFWHKNLTRAFLAQVESQCNVIRVAIAAHAVQLDAQIPANRLKELSAIDNRRSTERIASLSFRYFPNLFEISVPFDASGEDYRGFKAITDARERFTHPQSESDVCPFELFASMRPAMEWYFRLWHSILIRCISSIGYQVANPIELGEVELFKDVTLSLYREHHLNLLKQQKTDKFLHPLHSIALRLMNDTSRALSLLSASTHDRPPISEAAARRILVRTTFCEIEGTAYVAASQLHRYRAYPAPEGKNFLIGNHEFVREELAAILEGFSKEFGAAEHVQRHGRNWEAFPEARGLRNRLTHPRTRDHLTISQDELGTVYSAQSWWHNAVDSCLKIDPTRLPP